MPFPLSMRLGWAPLYALRIGPMRFTYHFEDDSVFVRQGLPRLGPAPRPFTPPGPETRTAAELVLLGPRWTQMPPSEDRDDPDYLATSERMDFAEAVFNRREALCWSMTRLSDRSKLDLDTIESIEESNIDPRPELIGRLAEAMHSSACLSPRLRFEAIGVGS